MLKSIGNNLIIKNGEIVCKDGQELKEYLKKFFKDGQEINVIDHNTLVQLNNSVGYTQCA